MRIGGGMDSSAQKFGSGQAVARVEDDLLLKGEGRFADDVMPPGQVSIYFLRSPYPHARIVAIDAGAARAMPGVLRVLTGEDVRQQGLKPMPLVADFRRADGQPAITPPRHVLPLERVRFVGECVAAVVAETLAQARDAAEAIAVDYQDLPHAVTLDDALAADAPLLHEVAGANDNRVAETRYGDAPAVDQAFARAAHVVELNLVNQRLVALALEPRAVLAWTEGDRLMVRMSSQMPTGVRTAVCNLLGLQPDQVRVTVGDVGGGFGMKTGAYPEDLMVAWCAHLLRRPVKWVADRSEEFLSSAHGRDIRSRAALALDAQGQILALRVDAQANVGAYATMTGVAIQLLIGPWVQTSVYHVPKIDFHYTAVLTNTSPTGAYRGAGRPEAIFTIERLMDEAARVSGIDRVSLRQRNFVRPQQMPYRNPMGQTYDTGDFASMLAQGMSLADWDGFERRAAETASRGRVRGLGLATFLEWTGGNAFEEKVNVRILDDGVVEVFTAVNAMGQGIATSLTQLVVDVFGVPLSQVRVVMGDTDRGNGFGSAGSRSLFTGGSAVSVGAQQALEQARTLAAQALEVASADLRYEQGSFSVAGTDLRITLAGVAQAQPARRIELDASQTASGPSWPNGCHICEVELDPDTGTVQLLGYTSMNDVGRVVNPMIVRGQLDGGAVQGIGQALSESVVYDRESGQLLTGSLMDYAAPRADVAQAMFRTEMDTSIPSLNNVLGVKGVGELGTIGATPAFVNAVADALARHGRPELAPQLQMPLTPQRVWHLLHGA
jgi:carbon-monoxide dehydrogenase large subunit